MISDRQRCVLDNLDRVTTDGARCEARFELDDVNVSMQIKSLMSRGLIVLDDRGCLAKASPRQGPSRSPANAAVLAEIRQALAG